MDELREAIARALYEHEVGDDRAIALPWPRAHQTPWLRCADAALAAIEASGTHDLRSIGKRWRHKKRGTTYRIAEPVTIQCETPIRDAEVLVAYRADADGTLWARRPDEFYDGRFEAVAARPRQPGSGAPAADG